jgi:uncharacterized membrane protein
VSELGDLESRVRAIEDRNSRVEIDKAWETSKTRRVIIAALVYVVIAIYLQVVVRISPWINAVVPTVAFMVSTLAFGFCKRVWIARREREST